MKRVVSLILCVFSLLTLAIPAFAAERSQGNVLYRDEIVLEDGITVIREITEVRAARSTDKPYTYGVTVKKGDTVVANVAISAVFRYDGKTVSVVSKAVARQDTYDGWKYTQTSFTSSGGTVTLNAKVSKFLASVPITMNLTCDKNGNISYS